VLLVKIISATSSTNNAIGGEEKPVSMASKIPKLKKAHLDNKKVSFNDKITELGKNEETPPQRKSDKSGKKIAHGEGAKKK